MIRTRLNIKSDFLDQNNLKSKYVVQEWSDLYHKILKTFN